MKTFSEIFFTGPKRRALQAELARVRAEIAVMESMGAACREVNFYEHMRNKGQEALLKTRIKQLGGHDA